MADVLPPPAQSPREEWRLFVAFLRRPSLPVMGQQADQGLIATGRMLVLDLAVMMVFIGGLIGLTAAGIDLPENLNSSLEMNLNTVLLVVLMAPLLEELVFRSWLSGRPRYLLALVILIVAGLVAVMAGAAYTGSRATAATGLALLGGTLVAAVVAILTWKKDPPGWFRTIFPGLFWLSSIGFALVHLFNYTEGALLVLLPLVVPQMVLGTMAAYVRVQYGLVFAIVLHALHNGFALSMAALAMSGETSG